MADGVTLHNLTVAYRNDLVLDEVNLTLPSGRVTALVGPNGSGKSTLLRTIRGLLKPKAGGVRIDAVEIGTLSEKALAKRIALLIQTPFAPDDLTVLGLVRLGRYPHQSFFRQWSAHDAVIVDRAMAATDISDLRDRRLDTLSGGQRQRVWLAMVLAQDTPIICLDEPINHLDLAHQIDCLDLVRGLNRDHGKTVIVVLHDLNLAARYADHLVVMKDGQVYATGRPEDLVVEALIQNVFDVDCRVITCPVHGGPLCIPLAGSRRSAEPQPNISGKGPRPA